jgi:hypothetical protein
MVFRCPGVLAVLALRTRQANGLDFSTVHSVSPLPAVTVFTSEGIFISFCGPKALSDR